MRPYSIDLRERVAAAVDEDEGPQREIARLFRVSVSFVSRLLQRRRQKDTLAPEPHGRPDPRCQPGRPAAPGRSGPGAQRRHPGPTEAAGRLQLQPDDDLACPAMPEIDLQEEDPARRRARLARRPGEAAVVPEEGEAGRAETAGFRGRVGGDHGDDPGLRLGPARRAGRRLSPRLVGIADRDRRVGSGRGARRAPGVPGVDRHRGVRVVCRAGAGAGAARRRRGRMGQPVPPSGLCRGGTSGGRCQVLPLPPYSPDCTPIERLWSKVKAYLRRVAARNKDAVYEALGEAPKATTQDIIGWFQLCAAVRNTWVNRSRRIEAVHGEEALRRIVWVVFRLFPNVSV